MPIISIDQGKSERFISLGKSPHSKSFCFAQHISPILHAQVAEKYKRQISHHHEGRFVGAMSVLYRRVAGPHASFINAVQSNLYYLRPHNAKDVPVIYTL